MLKEIAFEIAPDNHPRKLGFHSRLVGSIRNRPAALILGQFAGQRDTFRNQHQVTGMPSAGQPEKTSVFRSPNEAETGPNAAE